VLRPQPGSQTPRPPHTDVEEDTDAFSL
jgi:hypothetical protein